MINITEFRSDAILVSPKAIITLELSNLSAADAKVSWLSVAVDRQGLCAGGKWVLFGALSARRVAVGEGRDGAGIEGSSDVG